MTSWPDALGTINNTPISSVVLPTSLQQITSPSLRQLLLTTTTHAPSNTSDRSFEVGHGRQKQPMTSPSSTSGWRQPALDSSNVINNSSMRNTSSPDIEMTVEIFRPRGHDYAEWLLKIAHICHYISIAILGIFVVQVINHCFFSPLCILFNKIWKILFINQSTAGAGVLLPTFHYIVETLQPQT